MDNPDKYTDTFQHLTLAYELLLKDVMVVLGQILSDIEREKELKRPENLLTIYICLTTNTLQEKQQSHPWTLNRITTSSNSQKWEKNQFLPCIKAGLKAGHQKAINYSKVSAISQGLDENPITSLKRMREALIKHIHLDLES